MKKILVFISLFLFSLTVNASIDTSATTIDINEIKIDAEEIAMYDDEVEISYTISPADATNKEITWEVITNGVNVLIDTEKTNAVSGKIVLNVENANEEDTKITIVAKQNNKTLSSKDITIQSKESTIETLAKEVEILINNIDKEITNDNYQEVKEQLEIIEEKLEDEEVKEKISKYFMSKYEEVKKESEEFTPKDNTLITVITIVLVIIFTGLLFWIFNKED